MYKPFPLASVICHFKRELLSEKEQKQLKYVYMVIEYGYDTRDMVEVMIYKELAAPYKTWVRPISEVYDHVDKTQYPTVKQEHRFEYYHEESNRKENK